MVGMIAFAVSPFRLLFVFHLVEFTWFEKKNEYCETSLLWFICSYRTPTDVRCGEEKQNVVHCAE